MAWINLLIIAPLALPLAMPIVLSDRVNAHFRKYILRQPVAKIWGTNRYNNEVFYSPVVATKVPGKLRAYRYSASKIGDVQLNEMDGTGYYCGDINWKWL